MSYILICDSHTAGSPPPTDTTSVPIIDRSTTNPQNPTTTIGGEIALSTTNALLPATTRDQNEGIGADATSSSNPGDQEIDHTSTTDALILASTRNQNQDNISDDIISLPGYN
jgi:hypothetical protein